MNGKVNGNVRGGVMSKRSRWLAAWGRAQYGLDIRPGVLSAGMFPDESFDVIVSNLCLHNIYDLPTRRRALHEIVRVLKPGGIALISDYKLTGEYAAEFLDCGLRVEKQWGSFATTFPPLRVVRAYKAG